MLGGSSGAIDSRAALCCREGGAAARAVLRLTDLLANLTALNC